MCIDRARRRAPSTPLYFVRTPTYARCFARVRFFLLTSYLSVSPATPFFRIRTHATTEPPTTSSLHLHPFRLRAILFLLPSKTTLLRLLALESTNDRSPMVIKPRRLIENNGSIIFLPEMLNRRRYPVPNGNHAYRDHGCGRQRRLRV